MNIKAALLLGVAAALSGCEASNDRIPKREQGQVTTVVSGRIVSMRAVSVQSTDSGRNGAAVGAVLGQSMTTYVSRNGMAAAVGQLGSYAGVLGEQYLREASGHEFVIRLSQTQVSPLADSFRQRLGGLVSVVQTNSERLSVGDEVYLMIGSGPTRIARR